MSTETKLVKKGYSIRFSDEYRGRLEALASAKSRVTGKKVPLSEILFEAAEYGFPVLEREISHSNTLPFNVLSRTEKAIAFARSITQAAHDSGILVPGSAA